jgi:TonB family protein
MFDAGEEHDLAYIAMEFLKGKDLVPYSKAGNLMPLPRVMSIVARVADALSYAHENHVVHRDIKPANIMLLDDGSVKVMDFGVARLPTSNLTVAGTVVGSVRYMAPEQMMGERVDGRADVFSLAAVAYEMLTDQAPFPGKTITEVVSRVVHGAHVPPRQVDGRLPEALDSVFAVAFAIQASERFASTLEFARALWAGSESILDLPIVLQGSPPAPTRVVVQAPTIQAPPIATSERGGLLLLESDPSEAAVVLDGSPVGKTPLLGLEVKLGRHQLRFEAPGRHPVVVAVELTRERSLQSLSVSLPVDAEPQPTSFTRGMVPPRRIAGSAPAYPEAARTRGLEGAPALEITLDESGDVVRIALLDSAGALLDEALLAAVAGWRFSPATLEGEPCRVTLVVRHLFRR